MTSRCALCDGPDIQIFLERRGVPIFQNLPLASEAEARNVSRGDLVLGCCGRCGFISNVAFSEALIEYREGYENDQTCSRHFDAHVDLMSHRVVTEGQVRGKSVVEIGCGQGQFLRRLCALGDNDGVGYDPAYAGPPEVDGGRVRFVREYFGPKFSQTHADAVVCRHVIEHVPRPRAMLEAIRAGLGSSDAAVYFETPAVDWILERTAIEDVFFEHCSYFTAEALRFTFECSGFEVTGIDRVFGGQYLWLSGRTAGRHVAHRALPGDAARTLALALDFGRNEARQALAAAEKLASLRREGPVAVWGAGAKGVTFLNRVDPARALVDCVVDVNPRKQGRFIPGTGHPIVSAADLVGRPVAHVVVMNPNYADEIAATLSLLGVSPTLHLETPS